MQYDTITQRFDLMMDRNEVDLKQYESLPPNLPEPLDDGGARHLEGMYVPEIALTAHTGERVQLGKLTGVTFLYFYPMTGQPGVALPTGWDEIPGARGCTPQACQIRNSFNVINGFQCRVLGVSTQSSSYQREVAQRLHLPYLLLSDEEFQLTRALQLPTFEVDGKRLIKRLSLLLEGNWIAKAFYPVFPPNRSVDAVIQWLRTRSVESNI